jgi:LacI family transcriptional regulator
MTVSRVLQGRRDKVSAEKYERILEVMRELKYVPVRPVMQNRHIVTNTIGMVPYYRIPSRNIIDNQTFEGLCDGSFQHGYDLFIMLRGEAEWKANREELRFLDRRSDGFIFISPGCEEWQAALEALVEQGIPVVVCYRREVPPGVAWVDPDNERIVDLAVNCLTRHGHTRLAFLGAPPARVENDLLADLPGVRSNYDNRARCRRFVERLESLGQEAGPQSIFHISDSNWHVQRSEVQALVDSGATGVLCVNDHVALQVLSLAEEMGIEVPLDLSVIGVDDVPESAHRGLSSVGFGYDTIGRLAVEAWIDREAGKPVEECCRVAPVQLVERFSVGAPKELQRAAILVGGFEHGT